MSSNRKYLPQLDTLKLIAMLLVFSTHCYFLKDSPETQNLYYHYFVFSGVGVEFFIMVSGFFAAYTYKELGIKEYLNKKINRLFPVHWACLIIGGYLIGIHCGKIPYLTPLSVPLLQSLSPISGDTNPPSWTISTLLVLYCITPFLIKKFTQIPHRWLLLLSILLCFFSFALNFFFYNPSKKIVFYLLYVSPCFRIVTYSIGLLTGLFVIGRKKTLAFHGIVGTCIEIIPLAIIICLMSVFHKAVGYWYTIPIFLLILAYSMNLNGIISRALSLQCFQKIASVSYCFYLIHYPLLSTLGYYLRSYNITDKFTILLSLALVLGLSFIIAYFLNKYIEKPFVKKQYLTSLFSR